MSNFISPANGASQGNNFLPKKAGAKSTPSYSSDLRLIYIIRCDINYFFKYFIFTPKMLLLKNGVEIFVIFFKFYISAITKIV